MTYSRYCRPMSSQLPTDREAMFAPFLLDWSEIKTFFEEIKRNEAHSIGTETKNFYALKEVGTLADHEQAYLDTLVARGKNPGKNENRRRVLRFPCDRTT
jgi:hypothetical protein